MENAQAVTLLLVEDDDLDVMGIKRAMSALKISNPMVVARDGIEALEYLRGQNGRKQINLPYIILLDLNMPRMDGLEFLEEIRHDARLHSAIIFVLTTSSSDEDIVKAYQNYVAGYVIKADPEKSFQDALQLIDHYWKVVEMPAPVLNVQGF